MAQFKNKEGTIVTAIRWYVKGDHPKVITYSHKGNYCPVCGKELTHHGLLGNIMTGRIVCPGDWIVEFSNGKCWHYYPDDFLEEYEFIFPERSYRE